MKKRTKKRNSCSQNKRKITNNTDEKERVECWTLSLPYNYKLIKVNQHALINQMYQKIYKIFTTKYKL